MTVTCPNCKRDMLVTSIGVSKRLDCTGSSCGYRYTEKGPDPCRITDLARIHQLMLALLQQRRKDGARSDATAMHPDDYPTNGWATLDLIRQELGITLEGNWH